MVLIRKSDPITAEQILSRISEYDIYRYECPEFTIGNAFCNWMRGEKNPSMTVFLGQDGKLHHYDQGDSTYRGDCWDLVQQKYSIDLKQAIQHVAKVFMLIDGPVDGYKAITSQYSRPLMLPQRHSLIQCTVKRWTKETLGYWSEYGIMLEDLKQEEVYPVKELLINRRKQWIGENEKVFCYRYNNGYQVYMPDRKKTDKWKCNLPLTYIEGWELVDTSDRILITKSKKDKIYLQKLLPFPVLRTMNESIAAYTPEVIDKLKTKTCWVNYDVDSAGKKASWKATELLQCRHLNVPDSMLEYGVTDYSDWRKHDGNDNRVIDHLKSKGLI